KKHGREEIPLQFEPRVRAQVEEVPRERVRRADEHHREHEPDHDPADCLVDRVDRARDRQEDLHERRTLSSACGWAVTGGAILADQTPACKTLNEVGSSSPGVGICPSLRTSATSQVYSCAWLFHFPR